MSNYSQRVKVNNVKIDDPFWNEVIERVRTKVIPYQYEALYDRIEGAQKSYSIENFVKAARILNGEKERVIYPCDKWCYTEENTEEGAFHGWVFQDTDVYKWLEAVAFSLAGFPDKDLEKKADGIIDTVCSAQCEDGYLDTLYTINNPEKRFTNLRDYHELYCFGHLAEAGVAYYNATKKRKLLDASLRFADLVCSTFGKGKCEGYPGHEIAEMALVKLFELTGENKYLDTAAFFIEQRGKRPYYFDKEHGVVSKGENYRYNQAHIPPAEQNEATGHAVRGVYLYSAMADIAKYKGDEKLFSACKKIWDNIENKKLYITGAIGSTVHGEAFSFDYDLPNDLAYGETCASIGLVFFARRMAELNPLSCFGDVAERAMYNTILSGMALDGESFFYVNPLEVLPEASLKDERKKHIKPVRQKWFSCACCPPNLARFVSSIGEYAYGENGNTFFVHHLIGADIKSEKGDIKVISDYAKSGSAKIRLSVKKDFVLAVRIPSWSNGYFISEEYSVKDGYAYINVDKDSEISFDFKAKIRLVKCSNRVRANIGKVALQKGAFVYCLEQADNGADLQMLEIKAETPFTEDGDMIIAEGYRAVPDEILYFDLTNEEKKETKLKFIPYYRWGNRGENEMTVYVYCKKR